MKEYKNSNWLEPNSVCLATGNSVALNLMFEKKKDHQLFLHLWDKYLGGMTEVMNYCLSNTGWKVLFKTKSSEEISKSYHSQREKSKKANPYKTQFLPSRMISEHFRILLSQYVRLMNKSHGRRGTLVMERFRKYILKDTSDYHRLFNMITNQSAKSPQTSIKYRADYSKYDQEEEMLDESIWKVGKGVYDGFAKKVLKCMRLIRIDNPILRNYLISHENLKFNIPPP